MNIAEIQARLKPWMLPIAMTIGALCHQWMDYVAFLAPWLIFVMLLITFCRVKPGQLRVEPLCWWLLLAQIAGSLGLYVLLLPLVGAELAQGLFICVFCPTATAGPVIAGMLGGKVSTLITYSMLSNLAVALLAPVCFATMTGGDISMFATSLMIASKVVPLIVLPLVAALALRWQAPKVHRALAEHQGISFYVWAVSLIVVVGRAVAYVIRAPHAQALDMILLAIGAGVVCILQFWIGHKIGARCGDKVVGTQGLGQKNTVLAIWMAQTFLIPICSIAPAAYVGWQNLLNSLQLYRKTRQAHQNAQPAD